MLFVLLVGVSGAIQWNNYQRHIKRAEINERSDALQARVNSWNSRYDALQAELAGSSLDPGERKAVEAKRAALIQEGHGYVKRLEEIKKENAGL